MPRTRAEWGRALFSALVGAVLTATVQTLTFAESVHDDITSLKRDMRDVKCTVAVIAKSMTLPEGCSVNSVAR